MPISNIQSRKLLGVLAFKGRQVNDGMSHPSFLVKNFGVKVRPALKFHLIFFASWCCIIALGNNGGYSSSPIYNYISFVLFSIYIYI